MIKSKHILSYCGICEQNTVICYNCGNVCCQGGYQCLQCKEAYEHEELYFKNSQSICFAKDETKQIKELWELASIEG